MTNINVKADPYHKERQFIPVYSLPMTPLSLIISVLLAVQPPSQVNIYLTSDDGPGPGSQELYNFAATEKVKFTLFVVGDRVSKNDSAAQRFKTCRNDSLLLIASHSYSHASRHYKAWYKHADSVWLDFQRNQDSLSFDGKIARLPGRNCWRLPNRQMEDLDDARAAADSLAAHGYTIFGWDLEWRSDSISSAKATEFLEKIEKWIRLGWTVTPGNFVILFHDQQFDNPAFRQQIHCFLQLVRSRPGYRLLHLSQYPLIKPDPTLH